VQTNDEDATVFLEEAFADMYGMDPRDVAYSLEQVKGTTGSV
jgi:hypothetical protein